MALTVEDGTGITGADSFVSVADAQTELDAHGEASGFTDVAASATLTMDVNPSDGDTVVVNGKTYTFQTSLTNSDGNIAIGASAAATVTRLIKAFGLTGVAGVDYAAATVAHSTVGAAAGSTTTTVALTASTGGTGGNAYTLAHTFTSASNGISGATFSGGEDSREISLRVACRDLINMFRGQWLGEPSELNQALPWPRTGVYDEDGELIASTTIPSELISAQIQLAKRHRAGTTLIPDEGADGGVKSESKRVGPLSKTIEYNGVKLTQSTFTIVYKLLSGLLGGGGGFLGRA